MAADMTAPAGRAQAAAAAGTPGGYLVMHTAEEAARLLKVKRSWLERQAAARKIQFTMLGGSYRFSDRHIAEIVRMNEVAPLPAPRKAPRSVRTPRNAPPDAESAGKVAPLRPRARNGPHRG